MLNFCIDCKYCHKVPFKLKVDECHHDHYATKKRNCVTGELEVSYMPCNILRIDKNDCKDYKPTFWKKLEIKIFGV